MKKSNFRSILQVNPNGVLWNVLPETLNDLQNSFQSNHYLRLPQFLSPTIMHQIHKELRQADFSRRIHKDIAVELSMKENTFFHMLRFMTNDPKLFEKIEILTGCCKIGCFTGRVYRMAKEEHHDSWHNDLTENRMIALSINLSLGNYRGGHLEIRHIPSQKIQVIPNIGIGDAVLFRLDRELEHRVQNVEGSMAKTAYAGWFRSRPRFLQALKRLTPRRIASPA